MVLEIHDLSANYGAVSAVVDVTLTVPEGMAVGLVGANGAGKSTLLRCMAGMRDPDGGQVRFDGQDVTAEEATARVRRGIVLVPEGRGLFADVSVEDNVLLGSYSRRGRRHRAENRQRLDMVHELFPVLADRRNQLAGTLSGGEQQMAAIARGLMARPRVLLLDEPTLGLAPAVMERISDSLRALMKQTEMALIIAEQRVDFTLALVDRVHVMRLGRIVHQAMSKDVRGSEELAAEYFGGTRSGGHTLEVDIDQRATS